VVSVTHCYLCVSHFIAYLCHSAYPLKTDYLAFMGSYSSLVGVVAFAMMFVGAQVNQLLGWRMAALTTPGRPLNHTAWRVMPSA
jgi:ATP/ADP translocase